MDNSNRKALHIKRKEIACRESGAALVEFALILPVCLLMFAVVFEAGVMLNQYQILKRISYNATRAAVEFQGLERTNEEGITDASVNDQSHFELQLKIRTITDMYSSLLSGPVSITTANVRTGGAETTCAGPCSGRSGEAVNYVKVKISMQHRTLWSKLLGKESFSLAAATEGAYLL